MYECMGNKLWIGYIRCIVMIMISFIPMVIEISMSYKKDRKTERQIDR